jgi:hypothetical protein
LGGQTFAVGVQTGTSQLKSVSDLAKVSGVSLQGEVIYLSKAGLVVDGYDLRNTNIVVTGSNVTLKNSLLNTKTGYSTVYQEAGASGLTVENCTFDGQKSGGAGTVINSHSGAMTVRANEFLNIPSDGVNIQSGTVERNYFSGAGYEPGAHADAISVQSSTGPVAIRQNYIDFVKSGDAQVGTNAALKIVQEWDTPVRDVTADGNVLLGGTYTIYANGTAMTNVKIVNNDIGYSQWGDLYPASHGSNFVFASNRRFRPDPPIKIGHPAASSPKP